MTSTLRWSYLYKQPWTELRSYCNDMYAHPQSATRTYRWAEDAWLGGYLTTQTFYLVARDVQAAIDRWQDELMERRQERLAVRPLETQEELAEEERRLRKQSWHGYFDRAGWANLAQATREYRERSEQWEQQKATEAETRRQRRYLYQGHRTLIALRQYLRHGAAASPPPVSTPERTSPTL